MPARIDDLAALEAEVARLIRDPATPALEARAAAMPAGVADSGPALALRGEVARRRGDPAASTLLSRAVVRSPGLVAAWHSLALARVRAGDRAGARAAWSAVLDRDPDDAVARYQIGLTHHDDGDLGEAATWYEAQVERHPHAAKAWHNLGLVRLASGDAAGAAAALREAVAHAPGSGPGFVALGRALQRSGDLDGALEAWTRAHELDPLAIEPLERAAGVLGDRAALPDAIALLRRAIALAPDKAALRFAMAAHLSSLGAHDEAVAEMRRAVALAPRDAAGASALLFELQYDDALATREEALAAHRAWATRHADPLPPVARVKRAESHDRLRVGYVSPRFGAGPLATLFLPVLEHHDRERHEILLYSSHAHQGAIAARMRAAADRWRDLPRDDEAAARAIADDDLDLLVDLCGHAPGNRLAVLARRPAPVQAAWLDYADTTGMRAIDYLVGDAIQTPAAEAPRFCERLIHLPCRFAYRPLDAPVLPHADAPRAFTFGSFNRHAKTSTAALDAWRRILLAVPGARLVLRAAAFGSDTTVEHVRAHWRTLGVPVDRVDFLPWLPLAEALASYSAIDVALDPFPFNGGVTTCDALAHGVPVVAVAGERPIARQSASLLAAAGRPEWVAPTLDAYVDLAVALAHRGARSDDRAALATAVAASPLCDVDAFTKRLERAFAAMVDAGPRDDGAPGAPIEIA